MPDGEMKQYFVATVLTVYGIETIYKITYTKSPAFFVATVLTVYGIETPYRLGPRRH